MNAKTDRGARALQLNKMLEEASKKITRIEAIFPAEGGQFLFLYGGGFFQPEPIDYADVIISFSVVPSWNAAKELAGKEFVIGSYTFRIFRVEAPHRDARIDGFPWQLKARCTMKKTPAFS